MSLTQDFLDAVESKKVMRVRIMLKDSLLVDPTAGQFEEMENYAYSRINTLYDVHDGEVLNFDVSAWTVDYLNQQMVIVVNNFSRERVDLLKGMVRYLYQDKVNTIRNEQEQMNSRHRLSRKQVGTGVTVAGVAVAAVGLCTSHTLLVAGGAAAAIVGGIMIVTDGEG